MGVTLQQEEGNVWALRIEGVLKKSEFDAAVNAGADQWQPAARIKVLAIADSFEGWEGTEEWGDLSFFLKHGHRIEKIAIVADRKWEEDLRMFAADGFRRAPVKFFPSGQIASARAWLGE
jgi:hypothetical protein